VLWIRWKSHQ